MAFKRRDFLISLPLAAAAGAALIRFLPAAPAAAEGGATGTVSRLKGSVTVIRAGQEIAAKANDQIDVADTIRTAADSRAEVTFSDGSILTIGPASEVAVSFFAPEAAEPSAIMDLVSGIARLTVNKATQWGRFEVRTTTAVASVRGTDYLVEATPDKSSIFVAEGRVAVSSRAGAGTIILKAGQGTDVTKEYVHLTAKTWGAKRRDEAMAKVTFP